MKANNLVYIGLGSNLESPEKQIDIAINKISQLHNTKVNQISSKFQSKPMGPQDQPDYINSAISIETDFSPYELLVQAKKIEHQMGRVKKGHWRERVIDIDILLYKDERFSEIDLTIPHKGISERAFVLYPLAEIAPDLIIPGFGKVLDLKNRCIDLIQVVA